MVCRKCHIEIQDESKFCFRCGAKQDVTQKPKSRGNSTGTVFKRPNGTWIAMKTIGYVPGDNGVAKKKTISKSGFKTKREALEYLPMLSAQPKQKKEMSFQQIYDAWLPTHRASKSTLDCYRAAYKWFSPVHHTRFCDIDIDDLQECLDDCPKGKRTKENMKALCGLMYKYAIPRNHANLNMGQYLVVHADGTSERDALPVDALEKLRKAVGSVPYADYIVAQCYLGFRPSELLALDAKDYNRKDKAFIGGAKTDAGRDRVVTVSPKIQHIIDKLVRDKVGGQVFCAVSGKTMDIKSYREAFYEVLDAVGIDNPIVGTGDDRRHKYTPHSCRHTFATLMKNIDAPDKDKLRLIGHTSTEMLRYYQDVDIDSLRKITDAI